MTLEADLVSWAAARPDWQRDVLSRLCRQESFNEAAIADLADRLTAGLVTPDVTLTIPDIPGTSVTSAGVRLAALHDLTGVNALAPAQRLSFGPTGLTVVYGDNGSGKSGYARVLKAAAGSRVREDILNNVFEPDGSTPQGAIIDYRTDNASPEQQWKWPGQSSSQLQQTHFYDETSGDAYLSTDSEITYRPSALTLLDQLIAVCDAVRGILDQRLRILDAGSRAMPVVLKDTPAARFIAGLNATTTDADIDEGCQLPADASETLARLLSEEARLKASNPAKERERLLSLAGHVETVAKYCNELAAVLSADAIAELGRRRSYAAELRAAARVASSRNFDAEPVPGVGSETWRTLWEAARTFSEHEAYHRQDYPVTGGGARCVLCHQELSAEAGDRLRRFQAFMTDTTERDAAEAERVLATSRQSVQASSQLPTYLITALAVIRAADAALADRIDEWTATGAARATAAVIWLDGAADEPPAPVTERPGASLSERAMQVREQASTIDATTFTRQLQAASEHVATLQGQIALQASRTVIQGEVQRLKQRTRIEGAKKATDTGAITRKSSDLTRDYVTREVRDQFTRESERLRLRRITLDQTGGVKGQLLHRPALLGAVRAVRVTRVLSEGEQTALGLSGFFTEVTFDATKSAVVLDDPVTSLDHVRRSLVAQRLAQLAADRQVIVFTHEVTFVGDLVRHATEAKVPISERWIQHNGDLLGVCVDAHPWKAKDVAARINVLANALAAIKRDMGTWDQERYEEECASWAGKLSEAWERAVNLEIINEVVNRGTSQVRPMKFRILAAVTEQDDNEFQVGYGRCSEWARRHDKDPGVNFVAPEPPDMQAELDRFQTWFKRIKGYRN
jgi:hypothetical protein